MLIPRSFTKRPRRTTRPQFTTTILLPPPTVLYTTGSLDQCKLWQSSVFITWKVRTERQNYTNLYESIAWNSVCSLRTFYDTTETNIRGLDSLGQSESTYGSLLTPVILQKLPSEVKTNITRAHGSLSWCLTDLMQCLLHEVNILEICWISNKISLPQQAFLLYQRIASRRENP
jgi:hypothetical protein